MINNKMKIARRFALCAGLLTMAKMDVLAKASSLGIVIGFANQNITFSDSTIVYVDGKRIRTSAGIHYSGDQIERSFVVFGTEIKKEFGKESILVIVTKEHKNDQDVKQFLDFLKSLKNQGDPSTSSVPAGKPVNSVEVEDLFALYRANGEAFAYIIKPSEFNAEEFDRIRADLKGKGFDLSQRSVMTDNTLAELIITIKGGNETFTTTWNKNEEGSSNSFIVVNTNTQTGKCSVTLMKK